MPTHCTVPPDMWLVFERAEDDSPVFLGLYSDFETALRRELAREKELSDVYITRLPVNVDTAIFMWHTEGEGVVDLGGVPGGCLQERNP